MKAINPYRRYAAFHEAGHAIAAWHFGIYCWPEIARRGRSADGFSSWGGRAHVDEYHPSCTPFRRAIITWAGLIAGWLATGGMKRADLRSDYLFWMDWVQDNVDDIEGTDTEWLRGTGYIYRRRPARIAARVLDSRYGELRQVAALLQTGRLVESRVQTTQ